MVPESASARAAEYHMQPKNFCSIWSNEHGGKWLAYAAVGDRSVASLF